MGQPGVPRLNPTAGPVRRCPDDGTEIAARTGNTVAIGATSAEAGLLDPSPVAPVSAALAIPADRLACTTCGHRPLSLRDLHRYRQDLLEPWLYLDQDRPGEVVERHHCARCQPHDSASALACAVCGDGPLLAGELADQVRNERTPPNLARRAGWTSTAGARTHASAWSAAHTPELTRFCFLGDQPR